MRIWLNKHFGFSKGEFNGLILLILIIVILKSFPLIYNYYKPVEKDQPDLLSSIKKITISDQENTYSTRDRIENNKLLPYVEIENQNQAFPKKDFQYEKKEYVKKPLVILEINQADSAGLDQIKGIGPAYATRILKYRERLGGFYKKEQLMEVYGLDSVKYNEIKNQITINPSSIRTVNINTADFNALKTSPYLSYKQINAIIQYRKQHGNYINAGDLKKIAILTPQVIEKVLPYITFN